MPPRTSPAVPRIVPPLPMTSHGRSRSVCPPRVVPHQSVRSRFAPIPVVTASQPVRQNFVTVLPVIAAPRRSRTAVSIRVNAPPPAPPSGTAVSTRVNAPPPAPPSGTAVSTRVNAPPLLVPAPGLDFAFSESDSSDGEVDHDTDEYERDVYAALRVFHSHSGAVTLGRLRLVHDDSVVMEFVDNELQSVRGSVVDVTAAAKAELETAPGVCAVCGILIIGLGRKFCAFSDPVLQLLVISEPHRDLDLVSIGSVQIPVHRQGAVIDGLVVCLECHGSLHKGKVPYNSLAAGVSFGQANLPKMTFVETMLICRNRLFGCVVQLQSKGSMRLKGTCIAFPHPGTEVFLAADFDRPTFLFVGTAEDWAAKKRDLLAGKYPCLYRAFTVRPAVVLQWVEYLRGAHPQYASLVVDDAAIRRYSAAFSDGVNAAHVVSDPLIASVHDAATTETTIGRDADVCGGYSDTVEHILLTDDDQRGHGAAPNPLRDICDLVGVQSQVVTRSAVPMSEFDCGWDLVAGAFPHLFQRGAVFTGTVTAKQCRYLMLYNDGRFARDERLLFYLYDMLRRHRVVRKVRQMSLTGTEGDKARLIARFNSGEFRQQLVRCTDTSPCSPSERAERENLVARILKELQPYLRTASACGLTQDLSSATITQLNSMCTLYGMPSLFVTVSPADFNDCMVFKMVAIADGGSPHVVPFHVRRDRIRIANENPAFCAASFDHILKVILRELYGLCCATERMKAVRPNGGILGTVRAHYSVTEAQARGTLHFHQIVWMAVSPDVLLRCVGSPLLVAKVNEFLSRIVMNDVDPSAMRTVQVPQSVGTKTVYVAAERFVDGWEARNPIILPSDEGFPLRVTAVALENNVHDPLHRETCAKGPSGLYGCRMGMGKSAVDVSGPLEIKMDSGLGIVVSPMSDVLAPSLFLRESRLVVWELSRDARSAYITPFNENLCNVVPHNESVELFGAPAQCRPGLFYVAKYVDKPKNAISASIVALSEATLHVRQYPSGAPDSGSIRREWCYLLQRWLNGTNRRMEVSAPQAASFNLMHSVTVSSDAFWFVFPNGALQFLVATFPSECASCPRYTGSLHSNHFCPIKDMFDDEDDRDANDVTTDYISCNKERKVVSVAQHLHYFHAPVEVRYNLSLYEFSAVFDVVKNNSRNELVVRAAGRKRNARMNFAAEHPLFTTHVLRLRSKHLVPNISGRIQVHPGPEPPDPIRRRRWEKRLVAWARFCVVLFLPWDDSLRVMLADPVTVIDALGVRVKSGTASDTDVARYQFIYNCTVATQTNYTERTVCSKYRMRSADRWVDYGIHAPCAVSRQRHSDSQMETALEFIRALSDGSMKRKPNQVLDQLEYVIPDLYPLVPVAVTHVDCLHMSIPQCDEMAANVTVSDRSRGSSRFDVHPLNSKQSEVYKVIADWLLGVTSVPPLVCLLGGPGTGKSEVAKTLINNFSSVIVSTAWQGISASILRGTTLCTAFALKTFGTKGETRLRSMSDVELHFAQTLWDASSLLIIDEVSQVVGDVLLLVSERLKIIRNSSKPFGGIAVLLIGDFFQLPPCFGSPLFECQSQLFSTFVTKYLTEQVRSVCPIHTLNLQRCRSVTVEFPFADVDWSVYGYLTPTEAAGEFADATHICSTNDERAVLNNVLAQQFGLRRSRQVLRWRYQVPPWVQNALDSDVTLSSQQMYGLFVEGAPAFVTQNLSTERLICNGTACTMVSVGYHCSASASLYRQAVLSDHVVVEIPVPDFIVVRLQNGDLYPILLNDEIELRMGGVKFTIAVHSVDIGFACTFHKVQGLTLDYVVLHLANCSTLRAASIHVGMSRITTRTKMRLFPLRGPLDHVRKKKWSSELCTYMKKFL